MKRILLAAFMAFNLLILAGCGDGNVTPTFFTQILSDPAFDGYIQQTSPTSFTIIQGMSPTVQSVLAGIDPATGVESRAFLDFPLSGPGGVPVNAFIDSAFLDVVINSIQPPTGTIPIRIELVSFQPPTLLSSDFDRTLQPALAFTTIVPPIGPADVGNHVFIDVTPLMVEAQRLALPDFQVRILEDLGAVSRGIIEINDTTGANRGVLAPLLQVTYF